MTYEIYRYIFLGGAILTGIMLAITVILFFRLNIPKVISYLSGAEARKAIENIRNQNINMADSSGTAGPNHRERGKITTELTPSGKIAPEPSETLHETMRTEKIITQRLQGAGTSSETTALDGEMTNEGIETTVLQSDEPISETTVLETPDACGGLVIEYEITYIHTDEVIA